MIVKIISASGKTLETWYVTRQRRAIISAYMQNIFELDSIKDRKKCLVTLDGLTWTFDKSFFTVIWQFIYEAFQVQSRTDDLRKQLDKLKRPKKK